MLARRSPRGAPPKDQYRPSPPDTGWNGEPGRNFCGWLSQEERQARTRSDARQPTRSTRQRSDENTVGARDIEAQRHRNQQGPVPPPTAGCPMAGSVQDGMKIPLPAVSIDEDQGLEPPLGAPEPHPEIISGNGLRGPPLHRLEPLDEPHPLDGVETTPHPDRLPFPQRRRKRERPRQEPCHGVDRRPEGALRPPKLRLLRLPAG